ncbi:MAG: DUF4403 family protein [Saprospiraceae bacterium]
MSNNSFHGFFLQWSNENLSNWARQALTEELSTETFASNGFIFVCGISENLTLALKATEKTIFMDVPLQFTFSKPEGLFSIDGQGGITLSLACRFSCVESGELSMDLELLSHDWHEKPVLNMGNLDVPIEFFANLIIQKVKDKHWVNLNAKLNEAWNITKLLSEVQQQYARNVKLRSKPDFYLNFMVKNVVFVGFQERNDTLKLLFYLSYDARITDLEFRYALDPVKCLNVPLTQLMVPSKYNFFLNCTFAGLEKLLQQYLNQTEIGGKTFDVEKITIRHTSFFEVKLFLRSPIGGTVTIQAIPYFNKDQNLLEFANIKVDIAANQFFYQLSSPILEKMIRNRIEEHVPIDIVPILQLISDKVSSAIQQKEIHWQSKTLTLDSLVWDSSECKACLSLESFVVSHSKDKWAVSSI